MRSHLSKSFFTGLFGTIVILFVAAALPADAQITSYYCSGYPPGGNGQNYCTAYEYEPYYAYAYANGSAGCANGYAPGGDTEGDAEAEGGGAEVDSNASFTSDAIYVWTYAYSSAEDEDSNASAYADCYGNYSGLSDVFGDVTSASAYADSNP